MKKPDYSKLNDGHRYWAKVNGEWTVIEVELYDDNGREVGRYPIVAMLGTDRLFEWSDIDELGPELIPPE